MQYSLTDRYFCIFVHDNDGIPGCIQNADGTLWCLLFTSRRDVIYFAKNRHPNFALEQIKEIERRPKPDGTWNPIGLMRIASKINKKHKEITHFAINHTGLPGVVETIPVNAVATRGKSQETPEQKREREGGLDYVLEKQGIDFPDV